MSAGFENNAHFKIQEYSETADRKRTWKTITGSNNLRAWCTNEPPGAHPQYDPRFYCFPGRTPEFVFVPGYSPSPEYEPGQGYQPGQGCGSDQGYGSGQEYRPGQGYEPRPEYRSGPTTESASGTEYVPRPENNPTPGYMPAQECSSTPEYRPASKCSATPEDDSERSFILKIDPDCDTANLSSAGHHNTTADRADNDGQGYSSFDEFDNKTYKQPIDEDSSATSEQENITGSLPRCPEAATENLAEENVIILIEDDSMDAHIYHPNKQARIGVVSLSSLRNLDSKTLEQDTLMTRDNDSVPCPFGSREQVQDQIRLIDDNYAQSENTDSRTTAHQNATVRCPQARFEEVVLKQDLEICEAADTTVSTDHNYADVSMSYPNKQDRIHVTSLNSDTVSCPSRSEKQVQVDSMIDKNYTQSESTDSRTTAQHQNIYPGTQVEDVVVKKEVEICEAADATGSTSQQTDHNCEDVSMSDPNKQDRVQVVNLNSNILPNPCSSKKQVQHKIDSADKNYTQSGGTGLRSTTQQLNITDTFPGTRVEDIVVKEEVEICEAIDATGSTSQESDHNYEDVSTSDSNKQDLVDVMSRSSGTVSCQSRSEEQVRDKMHRIIDRNYAQSESTDLSSTFQQQDVNVSSPKTPETWPENIQICQVACATSQQIDYDNSDPNNQDQFLVANLDSLLNFDLEMLEQEISTSRDNDSVASLSISDEQTLDETCGECNENNAFMIEISDDENTLPYSEERSEDEIQPIINNNYSQASSAHNEWNENDAITIEISDDEEMMPYSEERMENETQSIIDHKYSRVKTSDEENSMPYSVIDSLLPTQDEAVVKLIDEQNAVPCSSRPEKRQLLDSYYSQQTIQIMAAVLETVDNLLTAVILNTEEANKPVVNAIVSERKKRPIQGNIAPLLSTSESSVKRKSPRTPTPKIKIKSENSYKPSRRYVRRSSRFRGKEMMDYKQWL